MNTNDNSTSAATDKAVPKIPHSNQHKGSQPIDEIDFALDLLRVTRSALNADIEDITLSAAHCISYALDALESVRPFVNVIDARVRQ